MAHAAIFSASNSSGYLTAQTIYVDRGKLTGTALIRANHRMGSCPLGPCFRAGEFE
ncbi:hypothetical protein [Mycolicibacterium canariasense]|uniref:hypothetical protein n=1 Tax=Mycolicibacterium canariasense TaxID=228230 RepID=UPI000B025084|nr:hypothetical protein [Mycolicibacterium canariasense]